MPVSGGIALFRARAPLLVAAVAAFSMAACGSAPAPPTAPGTGASGAGTETALEAAARDSFAAFLDGDYGTYFDLLSRQCREQHGFAAVESYLAGRRSRAVDLGGVDLSAVTVSDVTVAAFTGADAQVSLVLAGTPEPFFESQPRRWIFEEGGWHLADCSDIRGSQNSLGARGTDPSEPLGLGDVVDVSGWFVSLADVQPDFESVVSEGEVVPADDGNQLVSAQMLVTYNGAEPSVIIGEHLAFDMVAAGTTVFGDEAACVSELEGLFFDSTMEAQPGANLPRPLICREVPAEVVDSLLLRLTHTPSGEEYWFELAGS